MLHGGFVHYEVLRVARLPNCSQSTSNSQNVRIYPIIVLYVLTRSVDAKYLESTHICAGVGTAGRIGKLLSETGTIKHRIGGVGEYSLLPDSLSVKALTHIFIDTHLDVKQRSIFDIPETL